MKAQFVLYDQLCQPEQREDAGPLSSTEDRLVLRQQVCLVLTRRSQGFFIQQRQQHLNGVPTSVCSGVIHCVSLWLERNNNTSSVSALSAHTAESERR